MEILANAWLFWLFSLSTFFFCNAWQWSVPTWQRLPTTLLKLSTLAKTVSSEEMLANFHKNIFVSWNGCQRVFSYLSTLANAKKGRLSLATLAHRCSVVCWPIVTTRSIGSPQIRTYHFKYWWKCVIIILIKLKVKG